MTELAIELAGDGALVERDDHRAGALAERRHFDRDMAQAGPQGIDGDGGLGDAAGLAAGLAHQGRQGAIVRQQHRERPAQQGVRAAVKELLGRQVHESDAVLFVDHQDRRRKRVQDRRGVAALQMGCRSGLIHATNEEISLTSCSSS